MTDPQWLRDLEATMDTSRTEAAASHVHLVGYPVRLGMQQFEEISEVLREFQIIVTDSRSPAESSVPRDLLDLAELLLSRYGPMLTAVQEARTAAFRAGQESMTLSYPLVPDTRAFSLQYARTMESVDDFCRSGALIHLGATPEIYALRRWTVEELVRQYDGHPPRPWETATATSPVAAGTADGQS